MSFCKKKGRYTMISYRFATIEDIDLLIERRLQFIEAKTENSNFFEIFQSMRQYLERSFQNQTFEAILALDEDKVIGEGMIYYYDTIPSLYNMSGITACIENLHVSLKYRQNGIGGNMLQYLIDSASKRNADIIFANVSEVSEKLFKEHSFANIHNTMLYQG